MTDERIIKRLNLDELPLRTEELRQIQLERLQMVLNRAARNVSYYRDLFQSMDWLPADLISLEDLSKLPLTHRDTLIERQPYGMLAVAPHDVVRIHTALGTDGHPVVVAWTANDILHWTHLTARVLMRARVTRDDAVYISLDYCQTPGAFGMHYGAEAIGATVVPRSKIIMRDQVEMMKNYRATVLVCTPSYARQLIYYIDHDGYDPKSLFLRVVILVGEPWTESIRKTISQRLFVNVYGAYGLDEIFNPGIAAETNEEHGFLINEDHFLAEIIDLENNQSLPKGKTGELVLTTLTKEALPLLRYRTGEIASIRDISLENGRQALGLQITGQRTDDLISVGGARFYPCQVKQILESSENSDLQSCIVISPEEDADRVELLVEVTPEAFGGEMVALTTLKDRLESELYLKFGLMVHLRWMERGALKDLPEVDDRRIE